MEDIASLLAFRKGHFRLESGHHGELWIDLEALCLDPARVRPLAEALARRLAPHSVEVVCGPLVEGAFVALLAARALAARFVYTERVVDPGASGLFPVKYRLPAALRPHVARRRVAIVNDVVNAGSAVRGTLEDLREAGAEVVAVASLAVLGDALAQLARERGFAIEALAAWPNPIWAPDECPLCAQRAPLTT